MIKSFLQYWPYNYQGRQICFFLKKKKKEFLQNKCFSQQQMNFNNFLQEQEFI